MALAARNLEPFAETAKRVQGLTISAAQKLKIRAIVAGLCGKLEKLRVVAQSPALFVQFVGFLELVDIAQNVRQIERCPGDSFFIAEHLEDLACS